MPPNSVTSLPPGVYKAKLQQISLNYNLVPSVLSLVNHKEKHVNKTIDSRWLPASVSHFASIVWQRRGLGPPHLLM